MKSLSLPPKTTTSLRFVNPVSEGVQVHERAVIRVNVGLNGVVSVSDGNTLRNRAHDEAAVARSRAVVVARQGNAVHVKAEGKLVGGRRSAAGLNPLVRLEQAGSSQAWAGYGDGGIDQGEGCGGDSRSVQAAVDINAVADMLNGGGGTRFTLKTGGLIGGRPCRDVAKS